MLDQTLSHLLQNVLPAAEEYMAAESSLTVAYQSDPSPDQGEAAGITTRRKAAELALAIDGLTDRGHVEIGLGKGAIRQSVSALCVWPTNGAPRTEALERIRAIANAYKHLENNDPSLPISEWADVLAIGPAFGVDAWGVGKFGGVETVAKDKSGKSWKFSGDAVVSVGAWIRFLLSSGAAVPVDPVVVCGVQVYP